MAPEIIKRFYCTEFEFTSELTSYYKCHLIKLQIVQCKNNSPNHPSTSIFSTGTLNVFPQMKIIFGCPVQF